MSDDDYTIDQHDLLLMMAQHLITTGAHAIAPLRCDYGHCERSKGKDNFQNASCDALHYSPFRRIGLCKDGGRLSWEDL